jgi:hypothetical protein
MLSKAKRGDFKFMADKLFITQQFKTAAGNHPDSNNY